MNNVYRAIFHTLYGVSRFPLTYGDVRGRPLGSCYGTFLHYFGESFL